MKLKLSQFVAFELNQKALYEWCGKAAKSDKTATVIAQFMARDPGATDWRSIGLACPIDAGRPVHDLDGTARLLVVQFSERILPASVRDEALVKEIARIREAEDRDLNKKEYAQIKEDVEYKLLPKAFIRRTNVPVLVYPDTLMICATAAKKIDDVYVLLCQLANARNVNADAIPHVTVQSLAYFMGDVFKEGSSDCDNDIGDIYFSAGDFAKLKGEDKRAITIKDRDVQHAEIQNVFSQPGYRVTEMALTMAAMSEEDLATFVLNDRFAVKGIKLDDLITNEHAEAKDSHITAWLFARYNKMILDSLIRTLNQKVPDDESAVEAALEREVTGAVEDEEEL